MALFTNIPLDLAIKSVTNRWNFISRACNIPKKEFLEALKLVLESTYFTFDKKFYRQTYGTPMGSPLSPIIADMVMEDLETEALKRLKIKLPFYFRYVDDILTVVPKQSIDKLLQVFNSLHPRIQFTLEIGGERLNFLDVTIINNNSTLEFNVFHKSTFSGRYLSFLSLHPLSQKRAVIINCVDRVFLLSHPRYHEDNFKYMIEIFLYNDYPIKFIFDTINFRLRTLMNQKTLKQRDNSNQTNDTEKIAWFTIPFLPVIYDKFKKITKDINVKLAFFSFNKLDRFVKPQKDRLTQDSNKNVVYKIGCKDCNASYVGQTGRKLKTRLREHRNDINKKTGNLSVISEHRLELSHEFDFDNTLILDKERYLGKRLISEALYIKTQDNGLNAQSDTEFLHHAYANILNKIN